MSTPRERAGTRAAIALFRAALVAYPPRFRRRHGGEMVRLFRDRARRAAEVGGGALLRQLLGALADTAVAAPPEWWGGSRGASRGGGEKAAGAAGFAREVRWAARSLRRTPAFAAVAILTVALGIGASTAVFAVADSVLLEPLDYPEAGRLVSVRHAVPALEMTEAGVSDGTYLLYRDGARSLEGIGLYLENVVNLRGDESPERVHVALVTNEVFSLLGAEAAAGRLFTDEDQAPYDPDVIVPVVLGHDLWLRQYGGDPGIVGRTVELNAAPKLVVGVMEAGFAFPRRATDLWYPLGLDPASAGVEDLYHGAVARLRPGVGPEEAALELGRLVPRLAETHPATAPELLGEGGLTPLVRPLKNDLVGDLAPMVAVLMGAVLLLLVVGCANVGNLLLVRAEHRRREVALRVAVGAGRGDLARYVLGEGALLAAAGAVAGVVLAAAAVPALVALAPADVPRLNQVGLDGSVLAFAAGLAVACALVFGGAPTLFHRCDDLATTLRNGAQGAAGGGRATRARGALVAIQVALALVLLVGSALMVRSGWRLAHVDPGYDPGGVLTLDIALPFSPYPDDASRAGFWADLLEGIRAIPGVQAAGAVSALPLADVPAFYRQPLAVEGGGDDGARLRPTVGTRPVTPGYFEAMGIPVVAGRAPAPGERAEPAEPVLVSAALARRLFPAGDAVGRRVRRADAPDAPWSTIVGVVGDVRHESLAADPAEILYAPVLDRAVFHRSVAGHMSVALRTTLPPLSLAAAVREVVRDVDPAMPVANVRTMERIVAGSTARETLAMGLLLVASAVALFLSAVGIYGVVSYAVGRRAREIGVRIALGGHPARVGRMVVGEAARMAGVGLVVGGALALSLTGFLRGLLFEVSPNDPATFLGMAALLAAVALVAAHLPVRRAIRGDPVGVLREP